MPIKITKILLSALYACCDKPEGPRDFLKGILYGNGKAVASDAHTLICLTQTVYDPVYEGKIVDRNGDFIDDKYAPYESAIPENSELLCMPEETVSDLRKLTRTLNETCWIRVSGDTYLSVYSLRLVFRVFDILKQSPTLYINRRTDRSAVLKSENCTALSMPAEPCGKTLTYVKSVAYDYDLLGV